MVCAPRRPCRVPALPASRGGAFTLIELLVVISIIAVLVGILMPALGGARQASRRIKCLANLHSWGLALEMYYKDNKEVLPYVPPFYDINIPQPPGDPSLLEALTGYLEGEPPHYDENGALQVYAPYLCPSDRDDDAGLVTGFSYQYWAGGLMMLREFFRGERHPERTVTRFYELTTDFPVMTDAKPWHPGNKTPLRPGEKAYEQNALYFGDWHADWLRLDPMEAFPDEEPPGGP